MKKTNLLFLILTFVTLSNCSGQENRIELKSECLEYLFKNIIQSEDFSNQECANILKGENHFIMKRNESEFVTFSVNSNGKIDGEMIHIQNNDTLSYTKYDDGKLIENIQYKNKQIDVKEYLKDSMYVMEYPNFEEEWLIDGEEIFKSQRITIFKTPKQELLKILYIDNLGVTRFIDDFEKNSTFMFNSKGILIEESKMRMSDIRYQDFAPNGESILLSLSPNAFYCKPYENQLFKNTNEYKKIFYNDVGKLVQEDHFNINDQFGISRKTYYYETGNVRKKVVEYLTDGIKTRTFDINNKLINEEIEIIDVPIPTPEIDGEVEILPLPIDLKKKN